MVRSVEKSLPWIASTVKAPSPGMPKKDSSSSTPVNRKDLHHDIGENGNKRVAPCAAP